RHTRFSRDWSSDVCSSDLVNINLAGVFFHIDEDAFTKLHNYLAAVRKSISDPQGRDEIIRDIEARIAELFREKMHAGQEVVSMKIGRASCRERGKSSGSGG